MAMVIDNLFPVFALIALGHALRRWNFTTEAFLSVSDRLVYFIFFPAMLFWKIGSAPSGLFDEVRLYLAVILAVLVVYALSTGFILLAGVARRQAGSFSQSCYRFNTYVGMAVMMSVFGEDGVRRFGILIALVIPLINVLAIGTLTWFGGGPAHWRRRVQQTLKALAANPLVLGCIGGVVYNQTVNRFPLFLENALRLTAYMTLPLALLSIGGALTLRGLRDHGRLSLVACGFKLVVLPAAGWCLMKAFAVPAAPFKMGILFLSLPTSTALYVLSSQLNSDTELASAGIALSTLLSILSLSAALLF
jgi:predicted permease